MFPTARLSIVAPLLALALGACTTEQLDRPLSEDASLSRLTDCGQLRTYVGDVMLEQLLQSQYPDSRWYFDAPMAEDASADDGDGGSDGPSDYTTTNTQEEGVDEIDIVKTDGKHIFTVQDRALHIVSSWPVEDAELVATLELEGWAHGLFLKGDKLVVFQSLYKGEVDDLDFVDNWAATRVSIIDITDRSAPTIVREIDIEGYLADGRMVDGHVYAVMNHWQNLPSEAWELLANLNLPEADWSLDEEALEADLAQKREAARALLEPEVRALAATTPLNTLLPEWRNQEIGAADAQPELMHSCSALYRPQTTSQFNVLSIVHLDVEEEDTSAAGILSNGWTLYASKDNLYVAQTSWWWWWGWGSQKMETQIHKFHIADGADPSYEASGVVDGWLYDQFAMSEWDGHLRVASTNTDWWWRGFEDEDLEEGSNITVLKDNGAGNLDTVGELTGIAPGEQIYASRMMGEKGYVVTFEQVDPLFTVDLSDHTSPTLVGELKIPGFSSYLHPMGDDHLLAVGMAGTDDGQITGLAVNVFDVSDFADPKLAHTLELESDGWSSSEALWDHHAFTYHRDTLTIPAYSQTQDEQGNWDYFSGSISFAATADGISELGRVDHRDLIAESECLYSYWYDYEPSVCDNDYWYANVRRSVYIEDNLFTISNYGIMVNELADPSQEITRVVFYPESPGTN